MGLFGLFKKKSDETKVGNVEDFISLTRVYFQPKSQLRAKC